jgi:hypothetical protein
MRDPEVRVRRSASQALSRVLGTDVTAMVGLEDAQRRREVRRLSQVPSNPVRAVARPPAPKPVVVARVAAPVAQPLRTAAAAVQAAPVHRTAVAVLEVEAPVAVSAELTSSVLRELRAAIRGKSLELLVQGVNATAEETLRACAALVESGQAIRRGLKYFVA